MAYPPQQDKRILLGSNQKHQGAVEVYEQVISRHRDTYQWAQQRRYSMERQCLVHIVIHTLKDLEGLEFLEQRREEDDDDSTNNGMDTSHSSHDNRAGSVWSEQQLAGEAWVPASEVRIRQAVIESLEKGMQHQPAH